MRTIYKLFVFLALLGAARPAAAQFIGYTSLQTSDAVLATNAACTGAPQDYTTGTTAGFQNLGQTSHYITLSAGTNLGGVTAIILGSSDSSLYVALSDVLTQVNTTIYGHGRFPLIRVRVTCNSGSYSLNYSGIAVPPGREVGSALQNLVDKSLSINRTAGSNFTSINLLSPYGNSSGSLAFLYSGAGPAGSTLTVTCISQASTPGGTTFGPFTLGTAASLQVFPIGSSGCTFFNVAYVSGGASGQTFALDYVFNPPGFSPGADPCASGVIQSAVVAAGAAATTQVIALSGNSTIYVCGYQVSQAATAGTLQWVYGTGANCGTGTTNLTGAMPVTASQPFSYGGSVKTVMKTAVANALCLTTTGAGGTAAGIVTYVQQ